MRRTDKESNIHGISSTKEFFDSTKRLPQSMSENDEEYILYDWILKVSEDYKKSLLPQEEIKSIEEIPGWIWKQETPTIRNLRPKILLLEKLGDVQDSCLSQFQKMSSREEISPIDFDNMRNKFNEFFKKQKKQIVEEVKNRFGINLK